MQIKRIQSDSDRRNRIYYEFDLDSSPIGEGGMGVVYCGVKVDQTTGVRTDVAIKMLHEDLPDEVYARAEREASIQIKHTNLVEMFGLISEYEIDRFGTKKTRHYLISELLHGIDLSDVLNGKFDNKDGSENTFAKNLYNKYLRNRKDAAVEIIRSISSGVLALHDAGYIHRDIDPSNIMVTSDGFIKLIDFGIAKNINTLGTKDRLTTTAGKFIGKAEYASPELVLGDVKNQNYTTDIYALGILLYRLIVGRLPFTGTQYEILQQQLKSRVPVKNVEVASLAKVIRKATAKNQNDRYSSVAELRVAIDNASKDNRKLLPSWVKYAAAICGVIILCSGAYCLYDNRPTPSPEPIIAEDTPSEYDKALALLNSETSDSVKLGFSMMKSLANQGDENAMIEVGLTYFTYNGDTESDPRSNMLKIRQSLLGFDDNSQSNSDSIIEYLSKPINLPPEALYVLGLAKYKDASDGYIALSLFEQARQQIEKNVIVGHGYPEDDLKERLESNINILREP